MSVLPVLAVAFTLWMVVALLIGCGLGHAAALGDQHAAHRRVIEQRITEIDFEFWTLELQSLGRGDAAEPGGPTPPVPPTPAGSGHPNPK